MSGALIVGAGPAIGQSVAQRFAREQMPVAVVARTQETVDATVAATLEVHDGVAGFVADSTDESGLRRALDAAVAEHGVPEALVYNAAAIRPDRLGELSAAELTDTLAVNVVGAVTTAAHLGPRMAEAGRGTVVITGGMPETVPSYFSLSLGKAACRTVVSLLAKELGPSGVHVASVTVCDAVEAGTAYDPDHIAEVYWELHQEPADTWRQEVVFAP